MKKRNYAAWAISQILAGLSKTPEQEIINIQKDKNGNIKVNINGEVEISISSKQRKRGK
jgi:hypothetical protein